MKPRFRPGRKLLVASLGVAAISYVACGTTATSGNLAPPPDAAADAVDDQISGNLAPPPDAGSDATTDGGADATTDAGADAAQDAKGQ
jgi:hypothetical protein